MTTDRNHTGIAIIVTMGKIVRSVIISGWFLVIFVIGGYSYGEKYQLRDGRILQGRHVKIARVIDTSDPNEPQIKPGLAIDDGLRRIFMSSQWVQEFFPEPDGEMLETFKLKNQRVTTISSPIKSLGDYGPLDEFDEYGRRPVALRSGKGTQYTIQSITEINPRYVRVQAKDYVWDMRLSTNSIPRRILTPILLNQIDPSSVLDRTRLVRFYVQAELYDDALAELDTIEKDFGEDEVLRLRRQVRQLSANRWYQELDMRKNVGQYKTVYQNLKDFPEEGVSVEILQKVRTALTELDSQTAKIETIKDKITKTRSTLTENILTAEFGDEETAKQTQTTIDRILQEIQTQLGPNHLERFRTFEMMFGDTAQRDTAKLAMAISGWLAGDDHITNNLSIAVSLAETKELVVRYLTEHNIVQRQSILAEIQKQEAGQPQYIAAILAVMNPPLPIPKEWEKTPGYFEIVTTGADSTGADGKPVPALAGNPTFRYSIQLPPEYDPARRYPLIVTLNGGITTPSQQIDFFAGELKENGRNGHAARNGYIVMAPDWNPDRKTQYDFGSMSHAAVLYTLRDTFRRFSIDTDRVFITGHDMGGTAAWDIGISHPDLWAAVLPFNCVGRGFIQDYGDNAVLVPMYYIGGELDGEKLNINAPIFDTYIRSQSKIYPVTMSLFRGRGNESYFEEILRLFDFMSFQRRDFAKPTYTVLVRRPLDTFFWAVDVGDNLAGLPGIIETPAWRPGGGGAQIVVKTARPVNQINVTARAAIFANLAIYLTPDMMDFKQRARVELNGQNIAPSNGFLVPDIAVMLEDARTRSDRRHPFWVRLSRDRR